MNIKIEEDAIRKANIIVLGPGSLYTNMVIKIANKKDKIVLIIWGFLLFFLAIIYLF